MRRCPWSWLGRTLLPKERAVGLALSIDVLLSAEVSGLPGGDRLDCVKASDQCLKEQSCSTKFRTLRQCVAGKESNFSRATGLEAKDECRSAMEALKQKSLYNCRCKRGMKKEKNCLRIYWSMYQSLQGTWRSAEPPAQFGVRGCPRAQPGSEPAALAVPPEEPRLRSPAARSAARLPSGEPTDLPKHSQKTGPRACPRATKTVIWRHFSNNIKTP